MKNVKRFLAMVLACVGVAAFAACDGKKSEADSATESTASELVGAYAFDHYKKYERKGAELSLKETYSVGEAVTENRNGTVVLSESFLMLELCADNTFLLGGEMFGLSISGVTVIGDSAQYGTWKEKDDSVTLTVDGETFASFAVSDDTLTYDTGGSATSAHSYEIVLEKRTIAADAEKETYAGVYAFEKLTAHSVGCELGLGDEYEGTTIEKDFFILSLYADGTGFIMGDQSFGILHGHSAAWEVTDSGCVMEIENMVISMSVADGRLNIDTGLYLITLKK